MVKTCPFMSRDGKLTPCPATCAMNHNGTCALAPNASVAKVTADADQALRLALLKQLTTRSR